MSGVRGEDGRRSTDGRRGGGKRVRPPTAASLESSAAWYVERWGGTSQRLRQALMRRVHAAERAGVLAPEELGPLREVVEALVRRYAAEGKVDDAAWAASRAAKLVARGVAPQVVRGRLAAEGVDAGAALAEVEGDPELRAACNLVRRRRLGPFREGSVFADDLAKLGRAGFRYEIARKVLSMGREEIEAGARG